MYQHETTIHECRNCHANYSTILPNGGAFGYCLPCLNLLAEGEIKSMEYSKEDEIRSEVISERAIIHSDSWYEEGENENAL